MSTDGHRPKKQVYIRIQVVYSQPPCRCIQNTLPGWEDMCATELILNSFFSPIATLRDSRAFCFWNVYTHTNLFYCQTRRNIVIILSLSASRESSTFKLSETVMDNAGSSHTLYTYI